MAKFSKNLRAEIDACVRAGGTFAVDEYAERCEVSLNGTHVPLIIRHGQWHRDKKVTKTARLLAIRSRRLILLAELRQLKQEQNRLHDKAQNP